MIDRGLILVRLFIGQGKTTQGGVTASYEPHRASQGHSMTAYKQDKK